LRLAVVAGGHGQAQFERAGAGVELDLAEEEPREFVAGRGLHEVGGERGGRGAAPRRGVHAPVEGGAFKLVRDARPHLVLARGCGGEVVTEEQPLVGQDVDDLVAHDGVAEPRFAGEDAFVAPRRVVGRDVGGGGVFALEPDKGLGMDGAEEQRMEGERPREPRGVVSGEFHEFFRG
jgi:hypothetical protein